jgi:diaminopimelate epimerase
MVICMERLEVMSILSLTNHFSLRTYERGVEDETLSCGTGATAVAIAMNVLGKTDASSIDLNVEGGKLVVSFEKKEGQFSKVFLKGPAEFVFKGTIDYLISKLVLKSNLCISEMPLCNFVK